MFVPTICHKMCQIWCNLEHLGIDTFIMVLGTIAPTQSGGVAYLKGVWLCVNGSGLNVNTGAN